MGQNQRLFPRGLPLALVLCLLAIGGGICLPRRGPSGVGPGAGDLRVVSFNIRYDEPADGPNAWPLRKDLVAEAVADSRADIAALQEALMGQIRDLETRLLGYAWVGVGRDDGKEAGEFCPIFYLKDRFRLVGRGNFWLSETPDRPGKGWDAGSVRIVTWARLEDRRSGRTIFVFNTHLDNVGIEARLKGARLLQKTIGLTAGSCPVILMGDFNCERGAPAYQALTGETGSVRLRDSRDLAQEAPSGPLSSFNNFGRGDASKEVIDHIFVGPSIEVRSWGVLPGTRKGRYISDHNPVLAEMRLARIP